MSKFFGNDVWPDPRPDAPPDGVTLQSANHIEVTKRDIIRAHPELSAREIRKRYGISVNHVRVERANNFTKRKATGKLK